MTEKERKNLHRKGIFTVTQLSYSFRPRRKAKRLAGSHEKYHHSIRALAIRDRKIYIVGSPELNIHGTPVYLDVEGLPDRDFYYLIGLRVRTSRGFEQHSLWADSVDQERRIWADFLGVLSGIDNPVLIHYGRYESIFLKQMCDRYGEPPKALLRAKIFNEALNLLSIIFAQVYFPTYSNGLKDNAGFVGAHWQTEDPNGLHTIIWRSEWERTHVISLKDQLIAYNRDDCVALGLLTEEVGKLGCESKSRADVDFCSDTKTNWHRAQRGNPPYFRRTPEQRPFELLREENTLSSSTDSNQHRSQQAKDSTLPQQAKAFDKQGSFGSRAAQADMPEASDTRIDAFERSR